MCAFGFCGVQDAGLAEVPLAFGTLLGKNMAQTLFLVLDLTTSG